MDHCRGAAGGRGVAGHCRPPPPGSGLIVLSMSGKTRRRLFDERFEIPHCLAPMQRFTSFIALCVCGVFFAASAHNQTNSTSTNASASPDTNEVPTRNKRVLSMADCIQLALQNNLDIQIQRLNPSISDFT